CGSRSWPCTGTHAAREARPVWPIHERSKNVFPLAADADIRTTRSAPASRAERARRETIPPWTAGTTTAATGDRVAGLIAVRAKGTGSLRVLSATNAPDRQNYVTPTHQVRRQAWYCQPGDRLSDRTLAPGHRSLWIGRILLAVAGDSHPPRSEKILKSERAGFTLRLACAARPGVTFEEISRARAQQLRRQV